MTSWEVVLLLAAISETVNFCLSKGRLYQPFFVCHTSESECHRAHQTKSGRWKLLRPGKEESEFLSFFFQKNSSDYLWIVTCFVSAEDLFLCMGGLRLWTITSSTNNLLTSSLAPFHTTQCIPASGQQQQVRKILKQQEYWYAEHLLRVSHLNSVSVDISINSASNAKL